MITIRVKESQSIKRYKMSIYVNASFNVKVISLLKKFSGSHYHVKTREWELPIKQWSAVLDILDNYDLEIIGDLPNEMESKLKVLDKFYESCGNISDFKFKTKPFAHQRDSFEYALTHRKFLLADEQGLGKTKQSIDIAVSRKSQFKHCLIISCVNGLKWNWQREVSIHSDEKAHILGESISKRGNRVMSSVAKRLEDLQAPHDEFFLITNVETLRDKNVQATVREMCDNGDIGMVIIDEIHKCKNSTSAVGKAIHCCQSYYKLALTGTPLMNTPIDLYNVLKWLDVEFHTLTQFKNYYCVLGGFSGYEVVGYKHLPELQQTLNSVMVRRRKEDVLDLPPKIRSVEYIEMTKPQQKLYEDIKAWILQDIDKICMSPSPLAELIRLRQCTGYPQMLSSKITTSAKIDRLLELVAYTVDSGDKVVVFSNWTSITGPVFEALSKAKYNPALVTGEVKDKSEQVDMFMNDSSCKVIVGTIAAMGTGFTLTEAHTVIFLDSPWNAANKEQAEDRCHRIGTNSTVKIITLVAKDTIDERIEEIIEGKSQLSQAIVDNVNSGKVDTDTIKFLLS